MRLKYCKIYLLLLLLNYGCLFTGNDTKENNIVESYYISSSGGNNILIYRQPNAQTDEVIISSHIDSINYATKALIGITNKQYFIVKRQSREVSIYNSRMEFVNACKHLGIDNVLLNKTFNSK